MQIVIIGASHVGQALAAHLSVENNDITVIDEQSHLLHELQNRCDVRVVQGLGSHPDVLIEAQTKDADMLIAVSDSDEVNLLACQIAYMLFHTPVKIARVRSQHYLTQHILFSGEGLPIDVVISPEYLVMQSVRQLIEYPGALQVQTFSNGKVYLMAMHPCIGGELVGKSLLEAQPFLNHHCINIVAIYRDNTSISLVDSTTINTGDEIFFLTGAADISKMSEALGHLAARYEHIMVAGGGNVSQSLCQVLEKKYRVKVIEKNVDRARALAMVLSEATVLFGDASDRNLLINENIEHMDVFCALTNDDEDNIMSCLLAKRLGAKHVMALVSKTSYVDIIESSDIDVVISPQLITIGSILSHIRTGDIANVYSLRHGAAEAIEMIVHGEANTSRVVGRCLSELPLPTDVIIGALVRENKMLMPTPDLHIQTEDHIILFVTNKKQISDIEKLFQVSMGFFG